MIRPDPLPRHLDRRAACGDATNRETRRVARSGLRQTVRLMTARLDSRAALTGAGLEPAQETDR